MRKLTLFLFSPGFLIFLWLGPMADLARCQVDEKTTSVAPSVEEKVSAVASDDRKDSKQKKAEKSEGKESEPLEEIVVTATKTPKPRGNVTQNVDVISSEEIDEMVLEKRNLAEIVSHLPGVFVSVLGRNQPNWGSVGGLGTNYNTYMLDGLPMDSFADPMSIDPWIVDRVEVQRGPASVLYPNFLSQDFSGNQSPLAGTTNFILKERVDKPETRVSGAYGSFNTANGRIDHRNRIGNFHFLLGGILEYSEYADNRYKLTDAPSGVDMTEAPDYFNRTIDFRGTYFFDNADDHKLSVYAHHQWHDGDMGRPNRDLDHNYLTTQAKYETPVCDWGNARVQMGYLSYDRNFGEDYYPKSLEKRGVSGVDQVIMPADVSLAVRHWGGGLMTVGSDFQSADYIWFNGVSSSDRINDMMAQQVGVYAQEEYQWNRWIFRVGGRFNYTWHAYDLIGGLKPEDDDRSWASPLWSAGIRYKATDIFSVYANSGSSFLVPAGKLIGGTIRASDEGKPGFNGTLPNPDLDAEKGWASDLGLDIKAMPTLKLGARGFLNLVDDVVVSRQVHMVPNQSQAINGGKSTSYGAELWLQHDLNSHLSWFANYTYTHTNVKNDTNPDMDDVELSNYPEHMGNVGLFLNLPYDFKATVWLRLVDGVWNSTSKTNRIKLHSYEMLDMRLEKGIINNNLCRATTFVNLHNMTDNEHELSYYYKDPGFTALGGFQVAF